MKRLRNRLKIFRLIFELWLKRIVHRFKGQTLSDEGKQILDYVYELMTVPDSPWIKSLGYKRIIYEEMIADVMRVNNLSHDEAVVKIFLSLSTYDNPRE